jgi:hypothetical protein
MSEASGDALAGIDVPRIRVEGAIVEVLRALDVLGDRTGDLDDDRQEAVDQAAHAARHSMIEALRRCGRGGHDER